MTTGTIVVLFAYVALSGHLLGQLSPVQANEAYLSHMAPPPLPQQLQQDAELATELLGSGAGSPQQVFPSSRVRAEKIRSALRRYFAALPVLPLDQQPSQRQEPQPVQLHREQADALAAQQPFDEVMRIQTRSADQVQQLQPMISSPDSAAQERELMIKQWLEAADLSRALQQRDNNNQNANSDQQVPAGTGQPASPVAASGHKTIRNAQPVFMRLPPRFGKRTC